MQKMSSRESMAKGKKIGLTVYKRMLENIRDVIVVCQDGLLKYVNKRTLEMLGYDDEEELLNKDITAIIHSADAEKVLTSHRRRLRGEQFESVYDFTAVHKNGNLIPVEIRVNVFEWEGRPATLNFLIDITERKRIQRALQESENTYRTIFENTGTAMAIADENSRTVLVNDEMQKLSGYSREEVVGQGIDWSHFAAPQDIERLKNYQQLRLQDKSRVPRQYEFQMITKTGDLKNIFMTSVLIPGTRKTLLSMIDITGLKKAEAALRKSSELLHELLRNSLDIIAVFNQAGLFQYLSPSLTRLTGYRDAELTGQSCFAFIHPDDLQKVQNEFTKVVARRNSGIPTKFRFRKTDGSWIYLEALGNNCLDNPSIKGIIINARDITGRKQMENQLLQAQKMEAIGTLAGGIAHDFNNLLMGIQGHISLMLLSRRRDDPDFVKLNNMQSLVQSGADLAAKLLGFARGGQYELKPTDLNELVAKTVNIFGRTKKEIMIHQKYQKNIWPVEVDRVQIEQVLINLYVNAWQAMPHDGGDIYVETDNVALNEVDALPLNIPKGNYIRITITDTGSGMDEETRQRIFEPFFTTKERGRGVGLGLASAYGIVKEHGGMIDVMSELGCGTNFSIYLPASTKQIAKEPVPVKKIIKGNETILLVDDEASVVDVCGEMLNSLGYNVLQARNGKEALKIYEMNKGAIDLVILDMIMPGLSGNETFDALKLIDPEVRVMLSTGYVMNEQVKKMMGKGCLSFIQKPFLMEELSLKIRDVFESN